MSIFGNILRKIFPSNHPAVAAAPAPAPATAPGPATSSTGAGVAPAPGQPAAAPAPSAAPAATPQVDVERTLDDMAANAGQKLNWRTSIVDLMKLLGLDSSYSARKELAAELNYRGDPGDSAAMNIWLHKQVMTKLAANGGKVPADLKD